MATYAIGDLQGCLDPFLELLGLIEFRPDRDRIWLVGDLVNRGPKSLETLRYISGMGDSVRVVLGNHDLHLLMQAAGYGKRNAEDTLDPILQAEDLEELLDWLRSQPLFVHEGAYAMVHAGLLPSWSVATAKALADEVSAALKADNYREFLAHMWGSQPAAWNENLVGWDRLRVVVNAMTRMRFCTLEGEMDFRSKGPPDLAPPGALPWFAVPGRKSVGTTIICGHWSALGFRSEPDLLALDSGCLWGGSLTAVRLEDRQVFQLPCTASCPPTGWD